MGKIRLVAVAACAAAVASVGAGAASAGEITGTGQSLKIGPHQLHGKSICAFSGLNDDFVLGDTTAPRTQHPAPGDVHGSPNACQPGGGE